MPTPTVTTQGLAPVLHLPVRSARYPEHVRPATPVPVPTPPTHDLQLLADALAAAKQIVRELSHHHTEAILAEGVRPGDQRAMQSLRRALDLARAVLALQEARRGRPPY